jgi:hypothetical protein
MCIPHSLAIMSLLSAKDAKEFVCLFAMETHHKKNTTNMPTFLAEEKGEAIYVTGGKYVGLNGWRNLGKPNLPKQDYVILALALNNEIGVHLNKENDVLSKIMSMLLCNNMVRLTEH